MFMTYEQIVERMSNKDLSPFVKLSLENFEQCFEEPYKDKTKRLLLAIDCQNDFMEGGPLGVPGSIKDMKKRQKKNLLN